METFKKHNYGTSDKLAVIYTRPDKKVIEFNTYDEQTIHKMQLAGLEITLDVLGHKDVEILQGIIDKKKNSYKIFLISLLENKWYWRESGDEAEITADMIGVAMLPELILKKCKSTRPPSIEIMMKVINFYVGDRAEVYTKNTNDTH